MPILLPMQSDLLTPNAPADLREATLQTGSDWLPFARAACLLLRRSHVACTFVERHRFLLIRHRAFSAGMVDKHRAVQNRRLNGASHRLLSKQISSQTKFCSIWSSLTLRSGSIRFAHNRAPDDNKNTSGATSHSPTQTPPERSCWCRVNSPICSDRCRPSLATASANSLARWLRLLCIEDEVSIGIQCWLCRTFGAVERY